MKLGPRLRFFLLYHFITCAGLAACFAIPILGYIFMPPWFTSASEFGTAFLVIDALMCMGMVQLCLSFKAAEYFLGAIHKNQKRFVAVTIILLFAAATFITLDIMMGKPHEPIFPLIAIRLLLLSPLVCIMVGAAYYLYLLIVTIKGNYQPPLPNAPWLRAAFLMATAPMVVFITATFYYAQDMMLSHQPPLQRREYLDSRTYEHQLEKVLNTIETAPGIVKRCGAKITLIPSTDFAMSVISGMDGTQATMVFETVDGSCNGLRVALCNETIDAGDVVPWIILWDNSDHWSFTSKLHADDKALVEGDGMESLRLAALRKHYCMLTKR